MKLLKLPSLAAKDYGIFKLTQHVRFQAFERSTLSTDSPPLFLRVDMHTCRLLRLYYSNASLIIKQHGKQKNVNLSVPKTDPKIPRSQHRVPIDKHPFLYPKCLSKWHQSDIW